MLFCHFCHCMFYIPVRLIRRCVTPSQQLTVPVKTPQTETTSLFLLSEYISPATSRWKGCLLIFISLRAPIVQIICYAYTTIGIRKKLYNLPWKLRKAGTSVLEEHHHYNPWNLFTTIEKNFTLIFNWTLLQSPSSTSMSHNFMMWYCK